MRVKKQQETVRTITTGYVEADMLGHCMVIAEEIKGKQNNAQRPHREDMKVSKLSKVFKWFQTAPTACLRSLKAWQDKKDADVPKYLSGLRKQNRNGK
tara:strand:- start:39 stop:332 length:294 start_codon:yes stop_codon:yes gene_type:complete